mmetsp:Transcript_11374/g.26767  ORF Transcript_11374/g.26767 Transcript_11374/m.26767 type:complete len:220 (+) Transcript_11374:1954-2613(+)
MLQRRSGRNAQPMHPSGSMGKPSALFPAATICPVGASAAFPVPTAPSMRSERPSILKPGGSGPSSIRSRTKRLQSPTSTTKTRLSPLVVLPSIMSKRRTTSRGRLSGRRKGRLSPPLSESLTNASARSALPIRSGFSPRHPPPSSRRSPRRPRPSLIVCRPAPCGWPRRVCSSQRTKVKRTMSISPTRSDPTAGLSSSAQMVELSLRLILQVVDSLRFA